MVDLLQINPYTASAWHDQFIFLKLLFCLMRQALKKYTY